MNLSRALAAVLSLAHLCQLCSSAQAARRVSAPYQKEQEAPSGSAGGSFRLLRRNAKPASTLVIYVYAAVSHGVAAVSPAVRTGLTLNIPLRLAGRRAEQAKLFVLSTARNPLC